MDFLRETLTAERLCEAPFPPYRFVPGRNPHPTANPAGHSYHAPGVAPPPVKWVPPELWNSSPDYLYGCDLYNHGYWWEAHEAWEGLWQVCDKRGTQGFFLQGLIQVSACHLKCFVGHVEGLRRLRTTSSGYLRRVIAERSDQQYMGLDVRAFLAAVDEYYGEAGGGLRLRHEAARYPYIRLDR